MNPMPSKTSSTISDVTPEAQFNFENPTKNDKTNNNPDMMNDKTEIQSIEVKLCDFSFSQIMLPGKQILGMMGTVAYSGK